MTKHLRLIMLSLLAMICMGGYSQSEVDFTKKTFTNPYTFEHYNIVGEQGGNGNSDLIPRQNENSKDIRCYSDNKLTITSTQGKMKKIVFVLSTQGKKQCGEPTVDNGTVTRNPKSGTISEVIWEDPNGYASVTFTVGAKNNWGTNTKKSSGQLCFNKIIITDLVSIEDNRQDAGIHFAKDSYTADFANSTFNGAELVKPEGLEVAYEITPKTEGVSIAEDGTVTYPAVEATYTVTAKFAGNDTYKPATATYTLNVVDNRQDAGIQFAKDSYTADIAKGTFNGAELVKPEGINKVIYTISPESEGVSIAEDGTVTYPAVEATYKVTAKFDGNDTYKPATATYTLNVVDPNLQTRIIEFVAGVNKSNNQKDVYDELNNDIITISSDRAAFGWPKEYRFYNAYQSKKGETTISTKYGTITKIEFAHAAEKPLENLSTQVGEYKYDKTTKDAVWTGNSKSILFTATEQARASKITVTVKVPVAKDYTLDENSVNTIEAYENANVTLTRTFYKDGEWNTLCLPFAVADAKTAFDRAELREVDTENSKGNTIVFKEATAIEAGKPYLIKWANSSSDAVNVEKKFEGVTLVAAATPVVVKEGGISFNGFYKMTAASELGASVAAIGAGNKLFKVNEGEMKGFRAAFVLSSGAEATGYKVVIDGTATGIEDLVIDGVKANGRVYNLNGQYVGNSLNGLQPGLYIQNGKKVVVK